MKNTQENTRTKDHSGAFAQVSVFCARVFPRSGGRKEARAFTLLLAVLISSVLLAVGSAIFSIVSKQIFLSTAGRESQFSFYAADTGIECTLYWDLKQDAFSTTSLQNSISCGGGSVPSNFIPPPQTTGAGTSFVTRVTNFTFPIVPSGFPNGGNTVPLPCATVIVTRTWDATQSSSYVIKTQVESRGYNTCDNTNPLRLERAIRVTY